MNRLIIDLSSVCWTSLFAGKDKEFGKEVEHNGRKVLVNSAQHGYENAIALLMGAANHTGAVPMNFIIVEETGTSKGLRKRLYPEYKSSSNDKPPEAYEQFNLLKPMIKQALRDVGACIVTQPDVEADDIIAYLVGKLEGDLTIVSNDGDLAALMSDRVNMWKGGTLIDANPFGPFETRHIQLYKALVGDPSDTYPGAKGFGDKAFLSLAVQFGDEGLDAFVDLLRKEGEHLLRTNKVSGKWLATLAEDVGEFKPLQKVLDNIDTVVRCWCLAQFYVDKIDTMRMPLQWQAGMVKPKHFDERLRPYSQQVRLVTAENYDAAFAFFQNKAAETPWFALDIETATPPESDEWLASGDRDNKVDVFGSELVGCSVTFGSNGQYTYYMSVDHVDTPNLTSEQVRRLVALIPPEKFTVIQNFGFEGPILYAAWGEQQQDNGWHGFLPNCIDSAIMSSYVDENKPQGLKQNSKLYLDYDQETYAEVTTIDGVQHKMNQLTARHVLAYGADDTICTLALASFFRTRMEIEATWHVFLEVEQIPAYVCALAYHQGTNFSLQRMKELEAEDAATYAEQSKILEAYLASKGWEGMVTPCYKDLTPASVKEAVQIILGQEMVTQVRTVSKLAKLVEVMEHEDAPLLAKFIDEEDLGQINDWVARRFEKGALINLDSPKQMCTLLYDVMGLPVRIINSTTARERKDKPELAKAVSKYKKIWAGSTTAELSDDERALLRLKAKADDTAVDFALLLDCENRPEIKEVLECIKIMKRCATRAKMFYRPYSTLKHWKDGKIHGSAGQSRTVTRRFAPSDPNLAQLPKKGEGVKFRECFIPHHRNAVIMSVDFNGQELRQGAGQSMDPNMLACYVGDHKKDMHSMTAAGAMVAKWGTEKVGELAAEYGREGDDDYAFFVRLRKDVEDKDVHKLADDLRKNAKNVNFGAQYDALAPKLAETLIIPVSDAEAFLQAKYVMFPRFEAWKEEVKEESKRLGYVTTPMGARRHLRESLLSDEWGVADKALRQGPNFRIQGGSAEQTKLAMARMWLSGILFKLDMAFFAPIHDELVWSVSREHALESAEVVVDCMTRPYGSLPVPFLGSVSLGPNFGDQHETGDDAMEDPSLLKVRVPEALAEIFKEEVTS